MIMLWFRAFHIISMVAWFAGLFYLPRLFVYHADATDIISIERFKKMERRLFYGIMTPAGILTVMCGLYLINVNSEYYLTQYWFFTKLSLVGLLWIYHIYCGVLVHRFAQGRNRFSSRFYRFFNEISTLFLFAIILLTELKPF